MRILVTGATGYVGARLVPRLLGAGHEVRCLVRRPDRVVGPARHDDVEVVEGDVLDSRSVKEAAAACDAAYYLVHSMPGGKDFAERDRNGAVNFREAAAATGLRRIVYLGDLGSAPGPGAPRLAGRREIGRLLAEGSTPTTEVRAPMIVGSGSPPFEMLRYLADVLPVMITPRWVRTRCRPIAIHDVLELLLGAIEDPEPGDRVVEIGGPDTLTFEQMIQIYAEEAGLRKRLIIPTPLHAPRLSSLWVGLVTPLPASVARPLVEGLRSRAVAKDGSGRAALAPEATPFREAVRRALTRTPDEATADRLNADSAPAAAAPGDPSWSGGTVFEDRRVVPTDASPHHVFWAFSRVGGSVGYYGVNWAWRLRGLIDRLVGGVGLRRGRRHPEDVREGEAIDFWRVDRVVPNEMLRLCAEMRLPGRAWLEWRIVPADGGADLVQIARFRPRGLLGRLYWFLMAPFHSVIFPRMACRIAAAAEERGYSCAS